MKVILQQDVHNLGRLGDIVKVREGYARNFLVPRGLAVMADEGNVRRLEHQKRVAAARAARLLAEARALADRIGQTTVSIKVQAGEEGKLFGAVTNRDIAEAMAAEGVSVDRRQVELAEPIKHLGFYTVPVRLHADVTGHVRVYVTQQ